VPSLLAVAHLWFVFEDNCFLAFALSLRDGNNLRPLDCRRACGYFVSITDK
jgi:hypothetical protein